MFFRPIPDPAYRGSWRRLRKAPIFLIRSLAFVSSSPCSFYKTSQGTAWYGNLLLHKQLHKWYGSVLSHIVRAHSLLSEDPLFSESTASGLSMDSKVTGTSLFCMYWIKSIAWSLSSCAWIWYQFAKPSSPCSL